LPAIVGSVKMKPATIAAWPREARDEAARFAGTFSGFPGLCSVAYLITMRELCQMGSKATFE